MKSLENMDRITLSTEIVMDMIKLYEHKGKDFHVRTIFEPDFLAMTNQTIEADTIAVASYFNFNISDYRVGLIARKKVSPKNKDEQLLIRFKLAFERLQTQNKNFQLHANSVIDLLRFLFRDIKEIQFDLNQQATESVFASQKKQTSKRKDLETLIELYDKKLKSKDFELTLLATNFYVDFLNLHIFKTDNEMIATILLYILLFRQGFDLFYYVSFFTLLLEKKDAWNNAMVQAHYHWQEGFSQTSSLHTILIKMMLVGYDTIEDKLHVYKFDQGLNKSDSIENTITKIAEVFTKEDVREHHPYVSESTINRTLQRLKDEEKIRPLGVGRSAQWMRIVSPPTKFTPGAQMSLFGDED